MLTIILPTVWASFAGYLIWYVTTAKRNVSITLEDAKTLENPQKQRQLHRTQMATHITQRRKNRGLPMRMRIQIHPKTAPRFHNA